MYMHACVCVYIYTLELFIPQTQMHKIQTLASHRLNRFSMEGGGEGGMFIDCPEQMTSKLSKTMSPDVLRADLLAFLRQ